MKDTKENAAIFLTNTQTAGGKAEKLEFASVGSYYMRGGKYYITYKEHRSMGMGDSRVILKIEPGLVTMRRMGDFQTVTAYKEGEAADFIYRTPYGAMSMKTKTGKIDISLGEKGGELRFSYELFSGGESTQNEIYLRVEKDS